jgi:hypothetical protein
MTNHDGRFEPHCGEGLPQEESLSRSSPNYPWRATAIPETGPVEGNDAVPLSCEIEHSAQLEIGAGHAIAVQQHCGRTLAPFEVMEPHTLDSKEPAGRRMPALGLACLVYIPSRQRRSRTGNGDMRS